MEQYLDRLVLAGPRIDPVMRVLVAVPDDAFRVAAPDERPAQIQAGQGREPAQFLRPEHVPTDSH